MNIKPLEIIESHFHELIRARAREFNVSAPAQMPLIQQSDSARGKPVYFPIPGMYGGFTYWIEGSVQAPQLITESWSRVVGYSGQRHEITAEGTRLMDSGFV